MTNYTPPPLTPFHNPEVVTLRDVYALLAELRAESRAERQTILQSIQNSEEQLRGWVNDIKADSDKRLDAHYKEIHGNGKPGLNDRVRDLERIWGVIAWIGGPAILAIVLGAMGFIWALITGQLHLGP